ncbi:hypothetical protein LJC74_00210 [Eubacteriales bacterium OttesenSCG-928-A19]|nr:hypothetical protein [Eubacteriales bacterium OttesenSCG-928-A19]
MIGQKIAGNMPGKALAAWRARPWREGGMEHMLDILGRMHYNILLTRRRLWCNGLIMLQGSVPTC